MSIAKHLAQLGKLIAAHHGWPAAKAFKSCTLGESDQARLAASAIGFLKIFPTMPGACAMMSAAFAVRLEQILSVPVYVVAGTLAVEGKPVFGDRRPFDGPAIFGASDPDWDGHVWVMIGANVVDISLFRTAYSRLAPPELARHIHLAFGPNKGLYVDHWQRARQRGLSYEPKYVLSEPEVTSLMAGAFHIIESHQGARTASGPAAI